PGLSQGARWIAAQRRGFGITPSVARKEAELLERILRELPEGDGDRAKVLDRIVDTYAALELVAYHGCRAVIVPTSPGSYELARIRDRALDVAQALRDERERAERACAIFRREYPDRAARSACAP